MDDIQERIVSTNEKNFLRSALSQGIRTDGRALIASRRTDIQFGESWGVARVSIGKTLVLATVSAEVVEPRVDRPTDGSISFNVDLSPMASPNFHPNGKTALGVEISRIIEHCIKDSQCVNTEVLCIVAKERVWNINVNIQVLNHEGNIVDTCTLATIAALMYFRRPEVTVNDTSVTIHSEAEKNFIPLQLGCIPITTSFDLFTQRSSKNADNLYTSSVLDPSLLEDSVADGLMTIAVTPNQDILCVHATGGDGYSPSLVISNIQLAIERATTIYPKLKLQLDQAIAKKAHKIW